MPGLVGDPIPIVTRVGHDETEAMRLSYEPVERRARLERLLERRAARRREVDGSAGVVLAVAWRRIHSQNLLDRLARGQLALENLPLIIEAAKSWNEHPPHAILIRRGPKI